MGLFEVVVLSAVIWLLYFSTEAKLTQALLRIELLEERMKMLEGDIYLYEPESKE